MSKNLGYFKGLSENLVLEALRTASYHYPPRQSEAPSLLFPLLDMGHYEESGSGSGWLLLFWFLFLWVHSWVNHMPWFMNIIPTSPQKASLWLYCLSLLPISTPFLFPHICILIQGCIYPQRTHVLYVCVLYVCMFIYWASLVAQW